MFLVAGFVSKKLCNLHKNKHIIKIFIILLYIEMNNYAQKCINIHF